MKLIITKNGIWHWCPKAESVRSWRSYNKITGVCSLFCGLKLPKHILFLSFITDQLPLENKNHIQFGRGGYKFGQPYPIFEDFQGPEAIKID